MAFRTEKKEVRFGAQPHPFYLWAPHGGHMGSYFCYHPLFALITNIVATSFWSKYANWSFSIWAVFKTHLETFKLWFEQVHQGPLNKNLKKSFRRLLLAVLEILLMEEFRRSPVVAGSLSHYLRGVQKHPNCGLLRFQPLTVAVL